MSIGPVSLYPGSSQDWNQDTSRSLSPDPQNASENNTKCEKNCDDSEGEQTEQTDQNDQIKQGNVKLLSSQEIHEKMKSIESKKFGGRWSISEHKDRSKISSNLNNIGGIVKSKLDYHKDSTTFPTFKLDCTLYDGDYRDQVVYLKVSFDEKFMTQNQSTFTLDHKNTNVEISYGRLYSITQDHTCQADINANFTLGLKGSITSKVVLTSDGSCFPEKMTFDLQYPNSFAVSKRRVFNYVIVLSLLLIGYCYVISKQSFEAEQNQGIAVKMSMTTLSWNTIWNFCLFNIYLSYALQLQDYGYFAILACIYFILCFIFELKLLLICWKAKNMDLFSQGNEAVRRALITFYIKFYLIALMSLLTLERIIGSDITLFLLCGSTLFSQIIENAINKSRSTPNLLFAVTMVTTQCFFALYIKGCPSNVMELQPNYQWAIYFSCYVGFQLLVLLIQRKCGSRFFIPRFLRFWSEYNYYKSFSEDLEEGNNADGENNCCICLNPLCFREDCDTSSETQSRRGLSRFFRRTTDPNPHLYMKTPCGHKYHPTCLKSWMRRKLECPFCRSPIPALDEEEQ